MPNSPFPTAIDEDIRKVTGLIATAQKHLSEGRFVDICTLEDHVRALCKAVEKSCAKASPSTRKAALGALAKIHIDLDSLERELSKCAPQGSATKGATPAQAAVAYGKKER